MGQILTFISYKLKRINVCSYISSCLCSCLSSIFLCLFLLGYLVNMSLIGFKQFGKNALLYFSQVQIWTNIHPFAFNISALCKQPSLSMFSYTLTHFFSFNLKIVNSPSNWNLQFSLLTCILSFTSSIPEVVETCFTKDFIDAAAILFHSFTMHCISNVQLSQPHHDGIFRFFRTRCDNFFTAFPLAMF